MFRKKPMSSTNKAKLEHKLYLARESPEPIFDLSDCGLSDVPNGIFSLCKVFRKFVLRLDNNKLKSLSNGGLLKDLELLKVLNLQNNCFTTLPDEVGLLKNLKELYIGTNSLKCLPSSIGRLVDLEILDVSYNKLKSLPDEIGELKSLQKLILNGNSELKILPKTLSKSGCLIELVLDPENYNYPPANVASQGTEAIKKFLCAELGVDYSGMGEKSKEILDTVDFIKHESEFDGKVWNLQKIKAEKQLEQLRRENEMFLLHESKLQNLLKKDKEKLLSSIVREQNKLEDKVNELQQIKECDRRKLVEQLQETENKSSSAIKHLLDMNTEPLAQLLMQEKLQEEKLLEAVMRSNELLRKRDILDEMQSLIERETASFQQFSSNRIESVQSILASEMQNNESYAKFAQSKESQKSDLINKLEEDTLIQRAAVGTLLEKCDARSWGLVQQVKLVEQELANLTIIEMDKKKLELDERMNDLSMKRLDLSALLLDLLNQQQIRRAELLSSLKNLEPTNSDGDEAFWLLQYQRLLDQMPDYLRNAQMDVDIEFARLLLQSGTLQYIPLLAPFVQNRDKIEQIDENELISIGITDRDDRIKILDAVRFFTKSTKAELTGPSTSCSAPIEEDSPSAPTFITTFTYSECVVCMEDECQIIFIPCGHTCTCPACAGALSECPLCRASVERKIRVS